MGKYKLFLSAVKYMKNYVNVTMLLSIFFRDVLKGTILYIPNEYVGFSGDASGKESVYQCRNQRRYGFHLSLDQEDTLEKEMATCSSTLAWKISWTKEPGRLPSTGLQRVKT